MRRACIVLVLLVAVHAAPQAQVMEKVTFEEAVQRALKNNPTVQEAAAGILRAQAILQQVRSQSLPTLEAFVTTQVIDPVPSFSGSSINPRTQTVTSAGLAVPVFVPVRWAERNQASADVFTSQREFDDARRAVAIATGQAYLLIIAERSVVELNERARDTAEAHYMFANQRYEGGIGSRLNAVRAQQEVSSDAAFLEEARLAVRRTQEALGVLIAADGPVDAADAPAFDVPPPTVPDAQLVSSREDIQVIAARQSAAQLRASDSWKAYLPSVSALFTPTVLAPTGLFANARSWRAALLFTVPVFEGGERRGQAREREALVDIVRSQRLNAERQAEAEIRTAREAVAATERALAFARTAAAQANEVVQITDIAFREGASTNIELIDAQREARDAETAVAVAEHTVRRARFELLVSTGRFPQ